MDGGGVDEGEWETARERWRRAADALWAPALADEATFRRVTRDVGRLLGQLRRGTATAEDLLAVDAEPGPLLGVLEGDHGTARLLVSAACAVRADELEAAWARRERVARIAAARREGRAWVVLEESVLRTVEMHVSSGRSLVSTEDPLSGGDPFGLGEVVLDAETGEPMAGPDEREVTHSTRDRRDAERERWRAEISERLDGDRPDGFR